MHASLLGGSWVAVSGVISTLIWVISIVTLLISLLITTHEPPSGAKVKLDCPEVLLQPYLQELMPLLQEPSSRFVRYGFCCLCPSGSFRKWGTLIIIVPLLVGSLS